MLLPGYISPQRRHLITEVSLRSDGADTSWIIPVQRPRPRVAHWEANCNTVSAESNTLAFVTEMCPFKGHKRHHVFFPPWRYSWIYMKNWGCHISSCCTVVQPFSSKAEKGRKKTLCFHQRTNKKADKRHNQPDKSRVEVCVFLYWWFLCVVRFKQELPQIS